MVKSESCVWKWFFIVDQSEPYDPDEGNLKIIPGKTRLRKRVKKSENDEQRIIAEVSVLLSSSVLTHPWNKDKHVQIDEIVN